MDKERPSLKDKPVAKILPDMVELVEQNKCPFCKKTVDTNEFRDDSSRKEYKISGLCQKCQDDMFGR